MTLFQDISSKKKEEISFFIGKIVDFSMNAHFFVSCCTKRTLQIYDYEEKVVRVNNFNVHGLCDHVELGFEYPRE